MIQILYLSGILNTSSNIGQLVTNGSKYYEFYTIHQLKEEIFRHKSKILKITGFTEQNFLKIFGIVTSRIKFFDDILLSDNDLDEALLLTKQIDEDDTLFVALANHINAKLWTGDIKLIDALRSQGYKRIITTKELNDDFLKRELVKRKY